MRCVYLVVLVLLLVPATAGAAEPRWLASVQTTMTAEVARSGACGESSGSYRIRTKTRRPIPVREYPLVSAFSRPVTRVTPGVGESVERCDESEACGGGLLGATARPRFSFRTTRGAKPMVEVGTDTPEPFFIPRVGCSELITDRDGLLPRRFRRRVVKRVPVARFARDRFRIRIAAKNYRVSVRDADGNRLRGTGSFSMTIRLRPNPG